PRGAGGHRESARGRVCIRTAGCRVRLQPDQVRLKADPTIDRQRSTHRPGITMTSDDRNLGMDREISRRDFMNGAAMAAGTLVVPKWAWAFEQDFAPEQAPDYYPPTRTGMRGSHPGSFEVAHSLRDRRSVDLSSVTRTGESYDLVVVGGGMSGL